MKNFDVFYWQARHPSFKPKSSLHFRDFAFSQRNWKLETGNWKLEKTTLILMCYPISSFEFPVSASDYQIRRPIFNQKTYPISGKSVNLWMKDGASHQNLSMTVMPVPLKLSILTSSSNDSSRLIVFRISFSGNNFPA